MTSLHVRQSMRPATLLATVGVAAVTVAAVLVGGPAGAAIPAPDPGTGTREVVAADPSTAPAATPSTTPTVRYTPPVTTGPDFTTPVDLVRRDGRVDRFTVAVAPGAPGLSALYVWYRPQLAPDGDYGAWTQVSTVPVSTRVPLVQPMENTDGRIEVFFDNPPTYRAYQSVVDGPWITEWFSLAAPPWWGAPKVFAHLDGRLGYVQTTRHTYDYSEIGVWYVSQVAPSDAWGTWEYLGPGPFSVAVTYPSVTVDPTDGTVHIRAQRWSATACVALIDQLPGGGWSGWRADPANPSYCATA